MPYDANLPPELIALVQTLVGFGRDVTVDELNALLPEREINSSEIEDILNALLDHGVEVVID